MTVEPAPRVLLITGASRSGSTLLDRILGSAPGAVSVGEAHNIWTRGFEQDHLCGCGKTFSTCPYWAEVHALMRAYDDFSVADIVALQRRVVRTRCVPQVMWARLARRAWARQRDDYLNWQVALYSAITRASGAQLVVDSSKRSVYGLLLASRRDINLTVVHLVRDSRAVAFSAGRRNAKSDSGVRGQMMLRSSASVTARGWLRANALSMLLRRTSRPSMLVRYEDLVADPLTVSNQILALAAMPKVEPSSISQDRVVLPVAHTVSGNPMRMLSGPVDIKLDDEWRQSMSWRDRVVVTTLTAPLLVFYGYRLVGRHFTARSNAHVGRRPPRREAVHVERPLGAERTRPTVVLHVFGRMDRGGAELRTVQLCERMAGSDVAFVFGTLRKGAGALDGRIAEAGGRVIGLTLGPLLPWRLRRAVRRYDVDVVHSHVATFSGAVLMLARLVGVHRRIAHFRSDGDKHGYDARRRAQRWVMRWLLRHSATAVVAVSPSALAFSRSRVASAGTNAFVIPSGLDTEPFRRSIDSDRLRAAVLGDEPGPLAVHVGRSSAEKNRSRALEILAACRSSGTDLVLAFVGVMTPAERVVLADRAARLQVSDAVRFLGVRDDVADLLRVSDLSLVTSTREGLPGIVLESCAAGTPCVASDLPGVLWIAESFATVTPLGLDQADERWADAIHRIAQRPPDLAARASALVAMDHSAFSITNAEAAFRDLWTTGDVR